MASQRVIVCADDFAISPGVSEGILKLIANHRLSAVSCMTASRYWKDQAKALKPLSNTVDIGLHLTLTDQIPLLKHARLTPGGRLPNLQRLLAICLTNPSVANEVERELNAQLDHFVGSLGKLPDFIDGHQHVHQFPVIRDVLIKIIVERYRDENKFPYVRICEDKISALWSRRRGFMKALFIGFLSSPLRRLAQQAGISTNAGFSGIYDFSEKQYASAFEGFLRELPDLGLVMCHPGFADEALMAVDSLTFEREIEYEFLASDTYRDMLTRKGCVLSRFPVQLKVDLRRSEIPARM
jgi:chitin disaccharide deacetylase